MHPWRHDVPNRAKRGQSKVTCQQTSIVGSTIATLLLLVIWTFFCTLYVPHAAGASSWQSDFEVSSDQSSYVGNAAIVIQGIAPSNYNAVTLVITNPSGIVIVAEPLVIDEANQTFRATVTTGGKGWESDGTYRVTVLLQSEDQPGSTGATFSYSANATAGRTTTGGGITEGPDGVGSSTYLIALLIVSLIAIAAMLVASRVRSRGMMANGNPQNASKVDRGASHFLRPSVSGLGSSAMEEEDRNDSLPSNGKSKNHRGVIALGLSALSLFLILTLFAGQFRIGPILSLASQGGDFSAASSSPIPAKTATITGVRTVTSGALAGYLDVFPPVKNATYGLDSVAELSVSAWYGPQGEGAGIPN